jgi:hypothetical protein
MRDFIEIGTTPYGENCAQLGSDDYLARTKAEIKAFCNQLIRTFGPPPPGAFFRAKANAHDFGTYHELAVYFNDEDEEAVDYAFKCEGEGPEYWDEEARKELAEAGFPVSRPV